MAKAGLEPPSPHVAFGLCVHVAYENQATASAGVRTLGFPVLSITAPKAAERKLPLHISADSLVVEVMSTWFVQTEIWRPEGSSTPPLLPQPLMNP